MGARLRGRRGEHAVYFDHRGTACADAQYHKDCRGRWRGEVSLGYGPDGRRVRRKVSGSTKTAVKQKLAALRDARTGEPRAVRWDDGDPGGDPGADPPVPPHMAGWRSVRGHGDTRDPKSRRTLALPESAVRALAAHRRRRAAEQLAAGQLWQGHALVFASAVGTPLGASHVRRSLRAVCRKAGIGEGWAPRDLRHTFVSLMSSLGEVPAEEIASLVGHSGTRTTETVYRHEPRPVIRAGAEVMDRLSSGGGHGSA